MNLVGDVKRNKKDLKYTGNKRKTRGNVGLLLNGAGDLVTKDMEKAGVLGAFFALDFTGKTSLQQSQNPETREKSGIRKTYPQVREHLRKMYL